MSTNQFTAVVPVHGGWDYVERLLPDLDHPAIATVVLVNDAGPTPPADFVTGLPPSVQLHNRPTNGGFGAAVNTGVSTVTTPFVLIINADTEVQRSELDAFLDAVMAEPDAVHGPSIRRLNGDAIVTGRPFPTLASRLWTFALPLRLAGSIDQRRRGVDRNRRVEWLSGAVLGLATATFVDSGGFDERFHMYGEDVEWQRRLDRRGTNRTLHHDITFRHDVGHGVERNQAALDRRFLRFWQGELIDTAVTTGMSAVAALRSGLAVVAMVNVPFAVVRKILPGNAGGHAGISPLVYLRVPFQTTHPKAKV